MPAQTFPDKFDWVPLGGTKDAPAPAEGNQIGVMQAVRIKGDWNSKQIAAREALQAAIAA